MCSRSTRDFNQYLSTNWAFGPLDEWLSNIHKRWNVVMIMICRAKINDIHIQRITKNRIMARIWVPRRRIIRINRQCLGLIHGSITVTETTVWICTCNRHRRRQEWMMLCHGMEEWPAIKQLHQTHIVQWIQWIRYTTQCNHLCLWIGHQLTHHPHRLHIAICHRDGIKTINGGGHHHPTNLACPGKFPFVLVSVTFDWNVTTTLFIDLLELIFASCNHTESWKWTLTMQNFHHF